MKKPIKISLIVLAVVFIAGAAYLAYIQYKINRGDLLEYEGVWYTKEQIQELVGPQYYEVESKNTPEEVYAAFHEALLRGDKEGALALMREEKREQYREAFNDQEKFEEWMKILPVTLTMEKIDGNHADYDIDYGTNYKNTASFVKNRDGYWEIDGI